MLLLHHLLRVPPLGSASRLVRLTSTSLFDSAPRLVRLTSTSLFDSAASRLAALARSPSPPTLVAVCVDGFDPAYTASVVDPPLALSSPSSYPSSGVGRGVMPSFTNPNNVSIVTASLPSVHGIAGNYALDFGGGEEGGGTSPSPSPPPLSSAREVSMTSASMITCTETLLSRAHALGYDVIIVTAKDKLLGLLGKGLPKDDSVNVSADRPFLARVSLEAAAAAAAAAAAFSPSSPSPTPTSPSVALLRSLLPSAKPLPTIYDPLISVTVIEAGEALLRHIRTHPSRQLLPAGTAAAHPAGAPPSTLARRRPALLYLSTTDYVQHKHAPGTGPATDFYRALDGALSRLASPSSPSSPSPSSSPPTYVGVTADHGMAAKHDPRTGEPVVVYVEDELLSSRPAPIPNRTILPITDAHVVHHGALGGYATVYLEDAARDSGRATALLAAIPGVEQVLSRADAADRYALPPGRIGDLVVVADRGVALGKRRAYHDLSQVRFLRSHGGEAESAVPLFFSRPLPAQWEAALKEGRMRNWHVLPALLDTAAAEAPAADAAAVGGGGSAVRD
jgi:phosphonoacetate hydrolase